MIQKRSSIMRSMRSFSGDYMSPVVTTIKYAPFVKKIAPIVKNLNSTNVLNIKSSMYVKDSKYGGKGVFTTEFINSGETIEVAHCLKIPTKYISKENILNDYVFFDNNNYSSLVLGYGCVYNHKDDPNVEYYTNDEKTIFEYKAIKDINPGEELFISYGAEYFSSRNIDKIN